MDMHTSKITYKKKYVMQWNMQNEKTATITLLFGQAQNTKTFVVPPGL